MTSSARDALPAGADGPSPVVSGYRARPRVGAPPDPPVGPLGPLATDLAAACLALARRFAAGATLWCWSPPWPHHAQHVAVEFVHPVIVGKRALPSEAMDDADPVGALRAVMAAGDVLLAISRADDSAVVSAMARAPAWGVETLWIGLGERPPSGAADHVLWLEGRDDSAPHTGELVVMYHLLWELTHVCFEHPGLLTDQRGACDEEVCITCSDEGRLGEVIATSAPDLATVRSATGHEEVDTTLVGPVRAGDLVLIHAGTAIELVSEP